MRLKDLRQGALWAQTAKNVCQVFKSTIPSNFQMGCSCRPERQKLLNIRAVAPAWSINMVGARARDFFGNICGRPLATKQGKSLRPVQAVVGPNCFFFFFFFFFLLALSIK